MTQPPDLMEPKAISLWTITLILMGYFTACLIAGVISAAMYSVAQADARSAYDRHHEAHWRFKSDSLYVRQGRRLP
jgi:hypothetical protein